MINKPQLQYMKNDNGPRTLMQSRLTEFSITIVLITSIFGILLSCTEKSSKEQYRLIWYKDFPVIGSESSPRTADLNNDGVLDIVMGAGKNETQKSDMGIVAFNGATGELLW